MGKVTKKQLAERVGLLSVRVSLYRLVILLLVVTVAGVLAYPVFADYIQAGGQAPKIGNVEVYNEAPAQAVESLEVVPEGDIEAGGKLYYVPQNFLMGIEIKGDEYIDPNGLAARSTVEVAFELSATTTHAYEKIVWYDNEEEEDLIVENWYLDVIDAFASMGGVFTCGTTTKTSGTDYYVATNTATILASHTIASTYNSETQHPGLINSYNSIGSFFTQGDNGQIASSTAFLLLKDESFVCAFQPEAGASSTDQYAQGGFAGTGRLHMDINHRNN